VTDPLEVSLSPDALEVIAARAAEIVLERNGTASGSPWLTRDAAAAYLGLPVSRLEKDREIPCHRDGRRVLYNRDELDTFFLHRGTKD
jgi:excisionase family DNA binding protein